MLKLVSFDLDGTLVNRDFDEKMWFDEIPRLVSRNKGVSFSRALRECKRAYDEVGDERVEWYSVDYWLARFGVESEKKRLLKDLKHLAKPFPEARGVVRALKKRGFRLIVVSNACPDFLGLKLRASGLNSLVDAAYSVTSEFNEVKKTGALFKKILAREKVAASEAAHVGDHWKFDFVAPRSVGIRAFFLERGASRSEKPNELSARSHGFFVVRSLKEFAGKLKC